MNDIDKQISDLEQQIAKLKKIKEDQVDTVYQFAEKLHSLICNHNHTDGCSWFYEVENGVHDWSCYAHQRYLTKAQAIGNYLKTFEAAGVSLRFKDVIEIIKLSRGY